ncbi:MAG: radical SAM protein [Oligoflexia bacterium]|nr:radical SAM protein [Oligoflexia bacterium]
MISKMIFGPINSRRLGWSLGVDLVPFKTCSLDCIYCECGSTTDLVIEPVQYYSPGSVLDAIGNVISSGKQVDYITFSGGGEPTLYKGIGDVISGIRSRFPGKKVALITNSTMFTHKEVFNAALQCDVVLPSVDSVTEEGFKAINRPHKDLDLRNILNSLLDFSKVYRGELWVEFFVIEGINDSEKELEAASQYFRKLKPGRIQINTLDRPGTEAWIKPLKIEDLNRITAWFKGLPVEIISRNLVKGAEAVTTQGSDYDTVLATIRKRPLTLVDILEITGKNRDHVLEWLDALVENGTLEKKGTHWVCRGK